MYSKTKFQLDPTKNEMFSQRHLLWKIAHFDNVYRDDVAKVRDFNNGVYEEMLCLLSDQTEISFLST